MAIDPIPHDLANETTDVAVTGRPVEFRHPHGHLVPADLRSQGAGRGMKEVGPPRRCSQSRVGLHARDEELEVAGWKVEVDVELADLLENVEVHGLEARIERVDDTGAHAATSTVEPSRPGATGDERDTGPESGGFVGRAVVDDDPQGGRDRLDRDTVQRPSYVLDVIKWLQSEMKGDHHCADGAAPRAARTERTARQGVLTDLVQPA
jgi:hypothetical protein